MKEKKENAHEEKNGNNIELGSRGCVTAAVATTTTTTTTKRKKYLMCE
jgi:hypothetical protein